MKHAHEIILSPLVTEKTAEYKAANKYIFKVAPKATKIEIANAVEKLFNVEVASVNVMNYMGKLKRSGRSAKMGRRADWKKAIVSLSNGTIEII